RGGGGSGLRSGRWLDRGQPRGRRGGGRFEDRGICGGGRRGRSRRLAAGALLGLARSAASSAALELWGIVRLAAGASAAASAGVAFTPDLRFFSRMFAIKKRFLSPPGEDRVPFSS